MSDRSLRSPTSEAPGKTHEAAKKPTLMTLPNEVVASIVEQVPHKTLLRLSLVCRSFNTLVKPFLFRNLDLSWHSLSDLSRMYFELFEDRLPSQSAPLSGMHINKLSFRLGEELADNSDFVQGVGVLLKILDSVKSVNILSLEISLAIQDTASLHPSMACELDRIIHSCLPKVEQHQLYLDAYAGASPSEIVKDITTKKVGEIVQVYSPHTMVAIHMSGLRMADFPSNLKARLRAGFLRDLSIQGGSVSFAPVGLSPNLRAFKFSWLSNNSADSAGLETALRIIKSSATSLRMLALNNLFAQDLVFLPEESYPRELTHLQCLEIVDLGIGERSIFGNLLAHTELPHLQMLKLELKDIINLDCDVSKMLNKLPSIQTIELSENSMAKLNEPGINNSTYQILESKCLDRNISLQSIYTSLRCDSSDEFQYQWARLALLSKTLSRLDMTFQPQALEAMHSFSPISLPSLRSISLSIRSAFKQPCPHKDSIQMACGKSVLCHLLELLNAPRNRQLEVMCFIDDNSARGTVQALTRALEMKLFPNLEEISGALTASSRTCPEAVMKAEVDLKEACRLAGVDRSTLRLIGNKQKLSNLMDAAGGSFSSPAASLVWNYYENAESLNAHSSLLPSSQKDMFSDEGHAQAQHSTFPDDDATSVTESETSWETTSTSSKDES